MLRRLAIAHTARRAYSVRATTLCNPTQASLEDYLASHPTTSTSVSLYLLSTALPSSTLQPFISALQSHAPSSIGSFASSSHLGPTISIAAFDKGVTAFRTDLSGRPKAQVGRWQRPSENMNEEDLKGSVIGHGEKLKRDEGWAGLWRANVGQSNSIEQLRGTRAKSLLLLTDGQPDSVLSSLESMLPDASKIGLITAPTPFVTGRPHTLIHNDRVFSRGAVGLAIDHELRSDIHFGLEPLGEHMTIDEAQGNMLIRILEGNGNPTQTLISVIQGRDAGAFNTKEEDFFLRIGSRMVKILSGDPTRGALSLDMEESLEPGHPVQFYHLPQSPPPPPHPTPGSLIFSALRKADDPADEQHVGKPRIVDGFLGLSEDGFLHSAFTCAVPGASASWKVE